MKEKNLKRKMELKRRRQKILAKKALHKDIAEFMVNYWTLQIQSPIGFAQTILGDGFYGYNRMRSKDIISHFDEAYRLLKSKKHIEFYYKRRSWGNDDSERKLLGEKETEDERVRLAADAEQLMNRLIELAFDLDFDE